jgi:DNA invertase Pin-like site-specific DNA recombinase|nr:recombinase family protein [uncultured Cardiobacterium sp.]
MSALQEHYIFAYLRASTATQDAARAKQLLEDFATARGLRIASFYIETGSGLSLERPQLMKLIQDAKKGDILLVESVDRLSRLPLADWQELKRLMSEKILKIVVVDIPSTHILTDINNELADSIIAAMNGMLIDILAAVAHQDYITRRARQRQGIDKAKAKGKYKGRPANKDMHERVLKMLTNGFSYREIKETLGVSMGTIFNVKKMNFHES